MDGLAVLVDDPVEDVANVEDVAEVLEGVAVNKDAGNPEKGTTAELSIQLISPSTLAAE
tara:strand:+ start:836 stop:1012 length:177 start_codon:yes stop_codon:yes gene_type:complete